MQGDSSERVLKALPLPALTVEHTGAILCANRHAEAFTGGGLLTGRTFAEATAGLGLDEEKLSLLTDTIYHAVEHAVVAFPDDRERAPNPARFHFSPLEENGSRIGLVVIEPLPDARTTEAEFERLSGFVKVVCDFQHDINNQLMGLVGHAELLHLDATLDELARGKVADILNQGRRLQREIESLGTAARSQ